jgi:phosphate transport system substrate-binding protein
MGVDRQSPADYASRTSEDELSLDSERALPSVNDGEAPAHQVRSVGPPAPVAGTRRARAGRALTMAALVPVAAVLLAACSTGSPAPSPVATSGGSRTAALPAAPAPAVQSLKETGSTLLYPLFDNAWAPTYKSRFPNVTITTASTGSGAGISSAAAGTADIGASDAYLSSANVAKSPSLVNIPLVLSAQMVDYNLPGLNGTVKLSGTILAKMYQGTITTWDDPQIRAINPGLSLPPTKVYPIHRQDDSGDTFLFTTYLSTQDPNWSNSVSYGTTVAWPAASGERAANRNGGMVTRCQNQPGCVAYIGISYQRQAQAAGLSEAALLNGSGGYELPTPTTINAEAAGFASTTPVNGTISLINGSAAGAYPIVNYEYAIVSTKQPSATRAGDLKALLNWILTTGSSSTYLNQWGFQPLPAQVASISHALAAEISS